MEQRNFRLPTVLAAEDIEIVENALRQMVGVQQVSFHPETRLVTMAWNPPTR